ncbi:MAG: hypothetical protein ACP5GX_12585, partial [Anaerolineae bacterium]
MRQPIKLLMTWNVRPGREEAYLQYVSQDFPEAMIEANMQPTEAWYSIHGDWPEVRMGFVAKDLDTLQAFLNSPKWAEIKSKLMAY